MNIKFSYLYRDAGNYKKFSEVIFANPNSLSIQDMEHLIRSKLIDGEWFYAKDWGLPNLYFDDWIEDMDHGFHEFESLTFTEEHSNTSLSLAHFHQLIKAINYN